MKDGAQPGFVQDMPRDGIRALHKHLALRFAHRHLRRDAPRVLRPHGVGIGVIAEDNFRVLPSNFCQQPSGTHRIGDALVMLGGIVQPDAHPGAE